MKKYSILFFSFFISITSIFSQKLIIDDTLNLKAGIYKNFKEFRENTPSIELKYKVLNSEIKCGATFSRDKINIFYFDTSKKETKQFKDIFGFCDGNNIYIRGETSWYGKIEWQFNKVTHFNRFVFFQECTPVYQGTDIKQRIIDINTGEVVTLTKKKVEKLIEKDKELSAEFESDADSKDHLANYIIRYSQKHSEEIKR